jgi:ATP-dependent Zn protease
VKAAAARVALVAHHEAGHAVAAFAFHRRFKRVTIMPGDSSGGHIAIFSAGSSRTTPAIAHRNAVCALAGPAAQRRFSPHSFRHFHGSDDWCSAQDYAFSLGGETKTIIAQLVLWEQRAKDLVNGRWAQIEKVARALIERRTLTYEQFCNLLVPPVPQAVIDEIVVRSTKVSAG